MNCREFIEFLWQYLSAELSAEERAKFEAHLARCAPCVRYVQSYQETCRIGKLAFAPSEEPVPEEVPEELIQAILAAREKST
jgi:anti-sigma factor RsiW